MSMSFDKEVNEKTKALIKEMFGEPAAEDGKTFLFDEMRSFRQQEMKEIANAANQPATVGIHGEGEIVTMSDGTEYKATPQGWRKVDRE